MDAQTYWIETVAANPAFADESKRVTIPVAKIRKLMNAAHAEGCREAADLHKMLADYRHGAAYDALKAILKAKP
jgi:hypothetical protein